MTEPGMIGLLCQLTHAKSLQQICDLTYHITGNPVFISDLAHTILAYTKCVDIPDETWKDNIVGAKLDRNTLNQDREVGVVHVSTEAERKPVLVEDDYIPYPRIITGLIHEHKAVGVMVLTAYCKPFEAQDLELAELIASFVVPCLVRDRYHISVDKRTVENFFIKLLDGESFTREQVEKRMQVLDYQQKPYTYVMVMCNDTASENRTKGMLAQIRMNVAATLRCHVLVYNTLLVCVYGSDKPVYRWPEEVPELRELLEKWGLAAGVSRRLYHISELRDRYGQAVAVLEKGRALGRPESCFSFDSLSSFILLDHIPSNYLDNYCHEQISQLWTYDQEHGTELCATLQVYLEQAKSLSRTADILFVHRNTVRYRINRCETLLNNQLEDGNEIFAFILSLRIREYLVKACRPTFLEEGRQENAAKDRG